MHDVNVTELRRHLPDYLKQVSRGEQIRITSRGRIIARMIPERDESEQAKAMLAELRKTAVIGDLVNPVEGVEWTADADHL